VHLQPCRQRAGDKDKEEDEMRDAMDARIWAAHHDQFSAWVSERARQLGRAGLHVARQLPQTALHGLMMAAAVAGTLASFSAALAPIAVA
jgi:hypothetical protein